MSAKNAPAILPNVGQFVVVFVQPVHYRVWGMNVGSAPKCWTIHYEARSGWLQLLSSRRLWPCLTTCGASCLEEILIETLPTLSTHYQPRANYQHNINHNQLSTHNQWWELSARSFRVWRKYYNPQMFQRMIWLWFVKQCHKNKNIEINFCPFLPFPLILPLAGGDSYG